MRTVEVAPADEGSRLDAFLARQGFAGSVAGAKRLLHAGTVRVDGRPARKGARLHAGQVVAVSGAAGAPLAPDVRVALEVLHLDDHLIAVSKPPGLPSHPLRPGEQGTLASALVARFPECAAASVDPREGGLAHRLDVGTSGVLVAARSRAVWMRLRALLGGSDAEKVYLAEVVGSPPAGAPVVVDAPIGRVGRGAGKVRVGAGRGLLPARTEVWVRERRGETSLVEARLHRGRAHQVRAHLAHLGCPVLGDDIYGDERALRLAGARAVSGFRLHALRVSFVHPVTGARFAAEAPRPAWARTHRKRS